MLSNIQLNLRRSILMLTYFTSKGKLEGRPPSTIKLERSSDLENGSRRSKSSFLEGLSQGG
jgi:hypothetical protein